MRPRRIFFPLSALTLFVFSGCGYVHIGKMPETPATVVGDEQLQKENTDLRLEKKLLEQELAITRSQGAALRSAIENRTADGDTSKRLTEKLNDTTRELATLRASYAKIQLERSAANPAEMAALQTKLGRAEEQLAGSLRNYTQLQEEIGRLRAEVDRTRTENVALTEKVKVVTAQSEQAQAALAQLNVEFLAQKAERIRIEQDAATLRTDLESANTKISALSQQRTGAAAEARALAATDSTDSIELRNQLESLRKKVGSLESERTILQQQVAAMEAAAKNPNLAELQARSSLETKLSAALASAKMLRDENDQLKTGASELTRAKTELEAELTKAKAAGASVAQTQSLRDQLRLTQAQAATLAEENASLKARLASAGGGAAASSGNGNSASASSTVTANPAVPSGVTATFVTGAPNQITRVSSAPRTGTQGLRFHTVAAGDTLSKISNLFYGTPTRWSEILVANRDILGEDNNLVIGRTLRIP